MKHYQTKPGQLWVDTTSYMFKYLIVVGFVHAHGERLNTCWMPAFLTNGSLCWKRFDLTTEYITAYYRLAVES